MQEHKMVFMDDLREQARAEQMKEAQQALQEVEVVEPEVLAPKVIVQKPVDIPAKKDKIVHVMLDAKLEKLDEVKDQFACMDMDKWSKIFARLHTDKNVKVDANITARGIFAMFPVAVEEGG